MPRAFGGDDGDDRAFPSRAIYTVGQGTFPKGDRLDPPKRRSDYQVPSQTVKDVFANFPEKK